MSEINDPGIPQDHVDTPSDAQPDEPLSPVAGWSSAALRAVGAVAVGAGTLGRVANVAAAAEPLSTKVVVTDPSLCDGCLACEVNCSTWHASVGRSALPRIHILATTGCEAAHRRRVVSAGRAGFTPATCRHAQHRGAYPTARRPACGSTRRPGTATSARRTASPAGSARSTVRWSGRGPSRSRPRRSRASASFTTQSSTRTPSATSASGARAVRSASSGAR